MDRIFRSTKLSFLSSFGIYFLIINVYLSRYCLSKSPGHLKQLGSHMEPSGITWAGKFMSPSVFYMECVRPGKPILVKGALKQEKHPGLSEWTDSYLSERYGSESVKVERSKIENRDRPPIWMPLKEFLNIYRAEDVYMVQSLNNKMKDLLLIPKSLHCGGFQNNIQDAFMWMGSQYTSSVLHYDSLDNFLCVLDGQKDVVLIDQRHKAAVERDGFDNERGFSTVDPQEVDYESFPHLATVPWHEAKLKQGDCLFIPQGWYHQVTSRGLRHVSINIWFSHLWWFNSTNCPKGVNLYQALEPVSAFGFASPNEVYRSKFLANFKDEIVTRYNFHGLLPGNPSKERAAELFDAINSQPDNLLTMSELYWFDIDQILMQFSDLLILNGEQFTVKNKQSDQSQSDEDDYSDKEIVEEATEDQHVEVIQEDVADVHGEEAALPLPDHASSSSLPLPGTLEGLELEFVDDGADGVGFETDATEESEQSSSTVMANDLVEEDQVGSNSDMNDEWNSKGHRDEL